MIPASVTTRWNSISFTLEKIMKLRHVFAEIRDMEALASDSMLRELQEKIPTENDFHLYEMLLPFLLVVRKKSEFLSSDKFPTSCHVLPAIYEINVCLKEVCLITTCIL